MKAWEHPDEDVRLLCEVNLLGVIYGSRAAVEAMRAGGGQIVNIASLSALTAVPGLAVYAATKHAVLGFTTSLQGDLDQAGIPVRAHALCPDGAETDMTRERAGDPDSAIIWSAPRLLGAAEVADAAVAMLDSKRIVRVLPRWCGWVARGTAMMDRHALTSAGLLRRVGERKRGR